MQPSATPAELDRQKRSLVPTADKENPSSKKPRDRTPPPSRASREPLSPTQPKVASEQAMEVSPPEPPPPPPIAAPTTTADAGEGEGAGESTGEEAVAKVRKLEESMPGRSWYKLLDDAPVEGLDGKRVSIVSLTEENGVCVAEYKVEKARTKTAKLPARYFVPTGDKPKAKLRPSSSGGGSSSSSGSYPIERPTDEAQLQPLAEAAASEDGLEGAAAARDALASGVSEELAAQIDVLQVGLALQMSLHHIPLAEYEEHWGTACMIKMLTRAEFLFRVSGRTMHMSPPTRDLPEGLGERDNETRVFFFHYPPPPSARYGYTDPDGHATDDSTGFCEMAAQSAVPEGVSYPWICQNDISTDLFECATDYKGADGTDFSYKKHYLGTLSAEEETEDETTKVELLAAMMVAERMLRGRSGAIAYVAGEQPDLYAPALLEKAAAMATEELQSEDASAAAYMVRRPTDLPKAERATSKKAKKGEVGTASRVDHTCQALRAMPIDQRKRNDATITQVQGGILAGVPVRFFESLADKTEGGVGARLRGDTLAMTALHPYTGPFPPTNETEAAAREAAISAAHSERKRGGKELVKKAEAGDEEAAAESKRKASAGLEPEKQRSRGQAASGAGCGKGSNQSAGAAYSAEMKAKAKRVEHRCGCCNDLWMSAAKKPMHAPCRSKEGSGLCGPTCPTCGKP